MWIDRRLRRRSSEDDPPARMKGVKIRSALFEVRMNPPNSPADGLQLTHAPSEEHDLFVRPPDGRRDRAVTVLFAALVAAAVVATALVTTVQLRRDRAGAEVTDLHRAPDAPVDVLERAALDGGVDRTVDDLVAAAGTRLAGLAGIERCRFETFPFSSVLPQIARGVIRFPADEPGTASLATWDPDDGVEVEVCANGLQMGRFVLVGPAVHEPAMMPSSIHAAVAAAAERLDAALTARVALDPAVPLPRGGTTWQTSCSSPS